MMMEVKSGFGEDVAAAVPVEAGVVMTRVLGIGVVGRAMARVEGRKTMLKSVKEEEDFMIAD